MLGKVFLKNKPVALFVVIGGIVAASLLGLEARGVKLLGDVPQGLPAIGLPGDPMGRPERTAAAGPRVLPARRGGDRRHRPDVHRQARRPARRQPGVPRARRLRTSPPGSAAAFPSAAACRSRSSTKAAARARRSRALVAARHHPGGGAVLLAACCATCRSRCSPPSCWWRWRGCSSSRRSSSSGAPTGPSSSWPWPRCWACSARACCAAC